MYAYRSSSVFEEQDVPEPASVVVKLMRGGVVGRAPATVEVPEADGFECDAGALIFYNEFGKPIKAIAGGYWTEAWRVPQATPGDPSVGGTP